MIIRPPGRYYGICWNHFRLKLLWLRPARKALTKLKRPTKINPLKWSSWTGKCRVWTALRPHGESRKTADSAMFPILLWSPPTDGKKYCKNRKKSAWMVFYLSRSNRRCFLTRSCRPVARTYPQHPRWTANKTTLRPSNKSAAPESCWPKTTKSTSRWPKKSWKAPA